MNESIKNGYVPHKGMDYFTCPKCGNGVFVSYPQTVVTGADVWTFEYECTKCKHRIAMNQKDWRKR